MIPKMSNLVAKYHPQKHWLMFTPKNCISNVLQLLAGWLKIKRRGFFFNQIEK